MKLLAALTLAWTLHYSGFAGYVVPQRVDIDLRPWDGRFTGQAWVAPGATPYRISGRIVHGRFTVPGLVDTPCVVSDKAIVGVGVSLYRN
jgi:hypothetical protein